MGVEVPLFAAKTMLEQYDKDPATKRHLDSANIWFIPMINPDGHEYVRTTNPLWRKNRNAITQTACEITSQGYLASGDRDQAGNSASAVKGYGIDLNRNFWDGNPDHYYMYRSKGDKPCSTRDDVGASDDIASEIYRGASADSEKEVQAIKNLELDKANNIKGVIDFHAYGNDIFYPWGDKPEEVDNVAEYKAPAGNTDPVAQGPRYL
jgi:carboxypeptidase T